MAGRQRWTKADHETKENEDEQNDAEPTVSVTSNNEGTGVLATLEGFDILGRKGNQDRGLLWKNDGALLLMGVFDGHDDGGEDISEYCEQEFPKILTKNLPGGRSQGTSVVEVLVDTFHQLHESVSNQKGGCTASFALKLGDKIYIASAGDSFTIVVTVDALGQTKIIAQSRVDRPGLPEERRRIEEMGGRVESGRVSDGIQPGIAMSRCIGNSDIPGVISTPLVDIVDIAHISDNVLCISATDGLTDCIAPLEVAETIAASTFCCADGPDPKCVARDLVLRAAREWKQKTNESYRDDITVVAQKVK